MIHCSFRHIGGIGPLRERQLWLAGISDWSRVPASGEVLSPRLDGRLREGVRSSQERFAAGDVEFFARALPQTEHWRLLPWVLPDAGFLDIEAAGEKVTVIGVMDARGIASLRDPAALVERARHWKAVVTFNGTAFDLPVLKRVLPGWRPPLAHIDLRHVVQRLREKGGLKEIEPRFGLYRPPHLARLSGLDAVALWQARDLRRLVEYNLYDVFHLLPLAEQGYNRLLERTRMPAVALPVSDRGAMLYDVSRAVEAACGA
ncbi:MAG TPA: ribonuclease H-like domain-containing protein [Myxococcales bacterium]|nr:ribonuclease H-like domain-containing protein [Myxococcales bacterium]